MRYAKEDLRCYPRQTGHHAKLLLVFESCPVMAVILPERCRAAFVVFFQLFSV
jgi:hypothetical protein